MNIEHKTTGRDALIEPASACGKMDLAEHKDEENISLEEAEIVIGSEIEKETTELVAAGVAAHRREDTWLDECSYQKEYIFWKGDEVFVRSSVERGRVPQSTAAKGLDTRALAQRALRDGWIDFASTHGTIPTHFLSVVFKHAYSDENATEGMAEILSRAGRYYFGKAGVRHGEGFIGFAVAERHKISADKEGRLHFHLAISASSGELDTDRLDICVRKAIRGVKDQFRRRMTTPKLCKLSEKWDIRGLARYLTKNFYDEPWNKDGGIMFVSPGGLAPLA